MHILVVEDDRKSREFLARGLVEEGYEVDVAADGESGLERTRGRQYDLIVLDVMLPRRDGWSILRELRAAGCLTPVIFLTARDTVPDRVKGLELGADDYLVKPFAWVELIARVRTLLRRAPVRASDVLRLADLELNLTSMKARRAGSAIDLTPKEFQLLSLLARRAGDVLSRPALAEVVWNMHFTADSNAVDMAMGRLRRKVDEPFPRKLIHTVRGLGYVMEVRADEHS